MKSSVSGLINDIATYKNVFNEYSSFLKWLPNPDIVLRKNGLTVEMFKELLADPYVYGCNTSRKSGTMKLKWDLEKENGGARNYKFIRQMLENLHVEEIIDKILDAPAQGFQVMEILWREENQRLVAYDLVAKPIEWFGFEPEGELLFRSKKYPDGERVPDNKFIVIQHNPSYKNPYGESILTKCFWSATFKKGGIKFWMKFLEKYSTPWVDVKAAAGQTDDEILKLVKSMDEMVQDGVMVHRDNVEIDFKFAGAAPAEMYERLIELCKQEISIAFTGHQNTNMAVPGKLGNEDAAMRVRDDVVMSDKRLVEKTFNELIRKVNLVNFGEDGGTKFILYEEQEVDKTIAERDQILKNMGVQFTKDYYKKIYYLDETDFEVSNGTDTGTEGNDRGKDKTETDIGGV
jgi:phage gp29-like protein